MSTLGALIKQPAIQEGIAQYATTQLFNNYDVQGFVQQSLPPRAAFLAPSLTSQVKTYTQSTIKSILNNYTVQNYWYNSLTKTHLSLINFSKSYNGNGEVTISDIYSQLSKRLASTKLSFLANKQLPSKVSSIKITNVSWLPALHNLAVNINLYQAIAYILLVLFITLAIVFSNKKFRVIIKLGLVFAISMVATLIAIRVTRGIVVSEASQAYQAAIQSAYDTIFKSFISKTINILIISILVVIFAWIFKIFKLDEKIKSLSKNLRNKYSN